MNLGDGGPSSYGESGCDMSIASAKEDLWRIHTARARARRFSDPRAFALGIHPSTPRMWGSLLPAFLISHEKDPFVVQAPALWWCVGTELGPAGQEARERDNE